MDKFTLLAAFLVVGILIGVYYMQVPTTIAYLSGVGKMPTVGAQQYSAEYLYKNRPAAVAPVDTLQR